MKGTEKQIKYAEDIMNRALVSLQVPYESYKERCEEYPDVKDFKIGLEVYEGLIKALKEKFASVEEAKYVIENQRLWNPRRLTDAAKEEIFIRTNTKKEK